MKVLYQPGDIIGEKYRIVGVLGEGATAVTYEAVKLLEDNSSIAIKVLSLQQTQDWKTVELFEREVKVLQNLDRVNIPEYIDYFSLETQSDRQFCLVQELIPGKSLAKLLEEGWYFKESEVKNIAEQILEILVYLHSFQPPIIHRDIKPHNIIRSETGEIYIVDFGAVQDVYRNTLTRGATFVGTIDYMSPEQLKGQASFASDLYSLGCTLLHLLTRRSPCELPLERMKINFRSSLNISEQFASWLERLLEPVAEDRFSSTAEALERLNLKESRSIPVLAGSSIQINKKSNILRIKIPPTRKMVRLVVKYFTEFILALVAIVFLSQLSAFLLQATIANYNLLLLVITLFIWGIFLLAIVTSIARGFSLLFLFFGKINLIVDRHKFRIAWDCLGIKYQTKGVTSNIEAITITKSSVKESLFIADEHCTIYEGAKEHKLGVWLTKAERRWLVTEIANFVAEQYPQKNKEDWLRDIWKIN